MSAMDPVASSSSSDPSTSTSSSSLALPDYEWLYHVTTANSARLMQGSGMASALARTHVAVANPDGAFAKDREKSTPGRILRRVQSYLAVIHGKGYKAATAASLDFEKPYMGLTTTRNTEADLRLLEEMEQAWLDRFITQLSTRQRDHAPGKAPPLRSTPIEQAARALLQDHQDHFLVELAKLESHFHYLIEEVVTASYIYLTTPEAAADTFNSYGKKLGEAKVVVLRTRRSQVPGLEQDMSESKGVRTLATIPPEHLEVMYPCERFGELGYRCDPGNWTPLTMWTPPVD